MLRTIQIHADAPAKPRWGEPCNGCGVCCLSEPCPVGMVVSGRRHGPCDALRWDDAQRQYRCALMGDGRDADPAPNWLQRAARRFAARMIAAGAGCDCDIETLPAPG